MGLISMIKELFSLKKEMDKYLAENNERQARYLAMSAADMELLSGDELFDAVLCRTEHIVDGFDAWEEGVNSLNSSQKLFYCVNWLETEVNNGGLCQFFVNSSRMAAPLVSAYMGMIGAEEHQKLYDDFVNRNGINLNDLSFFTIYKAKDFEKKYKAYPFDEYDNAFYEMEPLETYLKKYIREHLEDF